jgi:hypothetical protein
MSIQKFLEDGTPFIKAVYFEPGETKVKGLWDVYIKADGVRVIRNKNGSVTSRNSKPLYNCDKLNFLDAEIFSVNWNTSVSLVRTESPMVVTQDMIYELTDGFVDPRLYLGKVRDPSDEKLLMLMQQQLDKGHEGLVIRQWNARKGIYVWLKVVPKKQADVRITGFKEGKGRLAGTLGSIATNHGSVGSGFDDGSQPGKGRDWFWANRSNLLGTIIQVEYREKTEAGKLRFPAFGRLREDKDTEDFQ